MHLALINHRGSSGLGATVPRLWGTTKSKPHLLRSTSSLSPDDFLSENNRLFLLFMGLYFFRSLSRSFFKGDFENLDDVGVEVDIDSDVDADVDAADDGFARMGLSLSAFLIGVFDKAGMLGLAIV